MIRAFQIPMALRAKAELELRRRRAEREEAEVQGSVVVMPAVDPLPVPPDEEQVAEGTRRLRVARENQLGDLLAAWRKRQEGAA